MNALDGIYKIYSVFVDPHFPSNFFIIIIVIMIETILHCLWSLFVGSLVWISYTRIREEQREYIRTQNKRTEVEYRFLRLEEVIRNEPKQTSVIRIENEQGVLHNLRGPARMGKFWHMKTMLRASYYIPNSWIEEYYIHGKRVCKCRLDCIHRCVNKWLKKCITKRCIEHSSLSLDFIQYGLSPYLSKSFMEYSRTSVILYTLELWRDARWTGYLDNEKGLVRRPRYRWERRGCPRNIDDHTDFVWM